MHDFIKKYLNKFLKLPKIYSEELEDYIVNTRGILLFILLLMSLGIMIVFGLISIKHKVYDIAIINGAGGILYIVFIFALRKNFNIDLISYVYAAILGSHFLYLVVTGGISNFGYVWTLLYPLGILFFFGRRLGLIISLTFLILASIFLFTISVYKEFGLEFQLRYIGIYSALMFISYAFELTRNKLNNTVYEKNSELREKITELEQKDKDLTIAKNKAEQADKLKSEFLAQMSHEIRTPINTILNYSSLIEGEFENKISGDLTHSFGSINKASNRLIRTIDMILNLSAIESGSYEPYYEKVTLSSDIIKPLLIEFEQTAKVKGLFLTFCNGANNEVPLTIDRYTLTQAVANLIDNAIKYTEEGGIEIKAEFSMETCKINIKDSGIGISEYYLPKLFEKFTQETQGYTRKYEGSGLGLTLVKKYCEVNNARISVDSKKESGTTFTIDLPISNNRYN